MFVCAVSRPDLSQSFGGKIGIWWVCITKTKQKTAARRKRGEEYEQDIAVNSEWYHDCCVDGLLPAVKDNMTWPKGKDATIKQHGANPRTGCHNPRKSSRVWGEGRRNAQRVAQPVQSPVLKLIETTVLPRDVISADYIGASSPMFIVWYE